MQYSTQKLSKLLLVGLLLVSSNAYSLKNDTEQPLNVVSKEQLADFNSNKAKALINKLSNKAIFLGNVVATQGSMELKADKAELLRNEQGELQEVIAYGKPATFKQLQDNGKVVNSQSAIIHYLPEKNLLILIGRATIWQDNSHVNGEKIEYNTVTKQLKATNDNSQGGRVQSIFIPQEFQNDKNKK